jgi:hypothetical protein
VSLAIDSGPSCIILHLGLRLGFRGIRLELRVTLKSGVGHVVLRAAWQGANADAETIIAAFMFQTVCLLHSQRKSAIRPTLPLPARDVVSCSGRHDRRRVGPADRR